MSGVALVNQIFTMIASYSILVLVICSIFKTISNHRRVGGGERAKIEDIPWQVAIWIPVRYDTFYCGGFVVSKRWVLSAAHCFEAVETNPIIHFGTEHIDEALLIRKASTIFIHSLYKSYEDHSDYDIAVLMLKFQIEFNTKVQPINFPAQKITNLHKYPALVSGYGSDKGGRSTKFLNYINVNILQDHECKEQHYSYNKDLHICVMGREGSHQSACHGKR